MVDAVRERYIVVMDDGFTALLDDLRQNGPQGEADSENPHPHMVDLLELTAVDNGDTTLSRTIHSPAEYSSFVDEGTEAHQIYGRPFLSWKGADGTRVIIRANVTPVEHPGTARTGWWSDTVANLLEYLQGAM